MLSLEDDPELPLGGLDRRREADVRGAAGAGRAQEPAGQRARPVGEADRRGDQGGARVLEEEGRRADHGARGGADGAGAAEPPGWLAFAGVQVVGLARRLARPARRGLGVRDARSPEGFQGTLRPYQIARLLLARIPAPLGLRRLPGRRHGAGQDDPDAGPGPARLGVEPGRQRSRRCSICPMSVVGNWQKEAARFTPDLPVMVHHGLERAAGRDVREAGGQARPGPLQLCAAAPRPRAAASRSPWAGVVLDEAQNIKNPQTKQAQAARRSDGRATASP